MRDDRDKQGAETQGERMREQNAGPSGQATGRAAMEQAIDSRMQPQAQMRSKLSSIRPAPVRRRCPAWNGWMEATDEDYRLRRRRRAQGRDTEDPCARSALDEDGCRGCAAIV